MKIGATFEITVDALTIKITHAAGGRFESCSKIETSEYSGPRIHNNAMALFSYIQRMHEVQVRR